MIIRPVSDLHMEFDHPGRFFLPVIAGEKDMTLVLAGDITAEHGSWKDNPENDTYTPWIKDVCARHKHVIYIKGNHEDYYGDMVETEDYWKRVSNHIDNLHFLHRDTVVLDGVRFLGCTLWTPLSNPLDQFTAEGLNDFDTIKVKGEFFSFQDWQLEHNACLYFIESELEKDFDGETVIVTHHAPSFQSVGERFVGQAHNVLYANSLERLMWYNPIKLWVHGHMHTSSDYIVGDEINSTRVLCNPRGYNNSKGDLNKDFDPTLTIEV